MNDSAASSPQSLSNGLFKISQDLLLPPVVLDPSSFRKLRQDSHTEAGKDEEVRQGMEAMLEAKIEPSGNRDECGPSLDTCGRALEHPRRARL